ncbi:hypothetical protein RI054_17g80440 [Pseudoscourfieldia marina]
MAMNAKLSVPTRSCSRFSRTPRNPRLSTPLPRQQRTVRACVQAQGETDYDQDALWDAEVMQMHAVAFGMWHDAMKDGKHLASWSVILPPALDDDSAENSETNAADERLKKAQAALIERDMELAGDALASLTLSAARRAKGENAPKEAIADVIEQTCKFCANTGAHPNDAISASLATDGAVYKLDRRQLATSFATLATVAPRTYSLHIPSAKPRVYLTAIDPKACFRVGNEVLTLISREPNLLLHPPAVITAANDDLRETLASIGIRTKLFQDALISEEPWLLLPGGLSNIRLEILREAWYEREGQDVERAAIRQRMRGVRTRFDDAEDQRWFVNAFCDGYG